MKKPTLILMLTVFFRLSPGSNYRKINGKRKIQQLKENHVVMKFLRSFLVDIRLIK